jgi:2-amino-4-hydroxy-6-hydroxymethyldihydropteridine diphosphokinase
MGVEAQPDFLNMVIAVNTILSPQRLLHYCQLIEKKQRRINIRKWGPRTLDIDILLFGQHRLSLPKLRIPHPELLNRDFVILPLFEIAPNLRLPTGEYLADYVPSDYTWIRKIMK